jgi:hypothetical protein
MGRVARAARRVGRAVRPRFAPRKAKTATQPQPCPHPRANTSTQMWPNLPALKSPLARLPQVFERLPRSRLEVSVRRPVIRPATRRGRVVHDIEAAQVVPPKLPPSRSGTFDIIGVLHVQHANQPRGSPPLNHSHHLQVEKERHETMTNSGPSSPGSLGVCFNSLADATAS